MEIVEIVISDYPFFLNYGYFNGQFDEVVFYDWVDYDKVRFNMDYVYRHRHFTVEFTFSNPNTFRFILGVLCLFSLIIDTDTFYLLVSSICYNFYLYFIWIYYLIFDMYEIFISDYSLFFFNCALRFYSPISDWVDFFILFFFLNIILTVGMFDLNSLYFLNNDEYSFYLKDGFWVLNFKMLF